MATFDTVAQGIGAAAVAKLRERVGDAWERFAPDEREACLTFYVKLGAARLREMAGEDVSDFKDVLEATKLQWEALADIELASALKDTAKGILAIGAEFVSSTLRGVLLG